ncbi:MAG: hypothetical protein RMJ56_03265 [Gemmataceae bacterium]|nr:hypothetical protein [Gemmata sp.]MDW8196608.1 hypothetical protein [Gemmataceae bacterium]
MILRPPVWVFTLARHFWTLVGAPPPYPRDLRQVLCWLPELHVVEVPHLTVALAVDCGRRFGLPVPELTDTRPLAGCFIGYGHQQLIIYDPLLDAAELRLTIAHETAHFLRDFDEPRRHAIARFGPSIRDVLDGRRPPTDTERLAGLLTDVCVTGYQHFLDRDHWGRRTSEETDDVETAAHWLACELLAPFDELPHPVLAHRQTLAGFLVAQRGFPPTIANHYAAEIIIND